MSSEPDTDADEEPFRLDDHVVLYIDLLGFSEAIAACDEKRAEQLFGLLSDFRALAGPGSFTAEDRPDGTMRLTIRPEVATFSDNLVATFPLLSELVAENWANQEDLTPEMRAWFARKYRKTVTAICVERVRYLISELVPKALVLGLLVRGALTIGKLFHDDGLILGEGLVDAYRLERDVAVYPRIVVSPRIYTIPEIEEEAPIGVDSDDVRILDYMPQMIARLGSERESWLAVARATIHSEMKRLEDLERIREFAKWAWFKSRMEAALVGPSYTHGILSFPIGASMTSGGNEPGKCW